jgi:hypothetical protein
MNTIHSDFGMQADGKKPREDHIKTNVRKSINGIE